jgi:putative transposase
MPWSVETPMSQRREFVEDAQRGLYTMCELCARYGISRRVGYKWLMRCGLAQALDGYERSHGD